MQCNFLVLSFLIINIFIWLFYLLDIKYHLSESVLSLSIVYQCEVLLQAESSVYRCQSFGLRVTSNICWDDLMSPAALQHCSTALPAVSVSLSSLPFDTPILQARIAWLDWIIGWKLVLTKSPLKCGYRTDGGGGDVIAGWYCQCIVWSVSLWWCLV